MVSLLEKRIDVYIGYRNMPHTMNVVFRFLSSGMNSYSLTHTVEAVNIDVSSHTQIHNAVPRANDQRMGTFKEEGEQIR